MIVAPDFLEHWKTRLLVDLLGSEMAPLCLIRLWAHCQNRRTDRFRDITPAVLKAICRWDGDGESLTAAMVKAGFVTCKDGLLVVHGWAELNARLMHNWKAGAKGGRPAKDKSKAPAEENPRDNPAKTQGFPKGKAKSMAEVVDFCVSLDLPASDGEACWHKWGGNGWKNGNAIIKDWKATIRSWKAAGYLPSQKNAGGGRPVPKAEEKLSGSEALKRSTRGPRS